MPPLKGMLKKPPASKVFPVAAASLLSYVEGCLFLASVAIDAPEEGTILRYNSGQVRLCSYTRSSAAFPSTASGLDLTDPSARLRSCFFDHFLPLKLVVLCRAAMGHGSEIFNRALNSTRPAHILFENKKRVNMSYIISLAVAVFLSCGVLAYGQDDPTTAVKDMVDDVVSILKKEELKGPEKTQERRTLLENAVGQSLDYEEMAKRTLALHWRNRTSPEQKEFVDVFHGFLSKTYAKRLETYSDETVQYNKVRLKDSYAEVQTKIASAKTELNLDYRLVRKANRWWIYDIVINGVSLIRNYRDQFDRIIRSSSYGELVTKLRDRTEEISTP